MRARRFRRLWAVKTSSTTHNMRRTKPSAPGIVVESEYGSAEFADALFAICTHAGLPTLLAARATCRQWRRTIDLAKPSSWEWRVLAAAELGASPLASGAVPGERSARQLCQMLSVHPLRNWTLDIQEAITAPFLCALLAWFEAAAEVAAVEISVSFNQILNGQAKSQASIAVYTACSQKPPHNLQPLVYSWWMRAAFGVARTIRTRLAGSSAEAQDAARVSFASFVKFMTSIVLAYLDRFYVRKFEVVGDPTSSLPPVGEIGARALAILDHPFDAPLPPGDFKCEHVPITAEGLVDEAALGQRRRLAWQQREVEHYALAPPPPLAPGAGLPALDPAALDFVAYDVELN